MTRRRQPQATAKSRRPEGGEERGKLTERLRKALDGLRAAGRSGSAAAVRRDPRRKKVACRRCRAPRLGLVGEEEAGDGDARIWHGDEARRRQWSQASRAEAMAALERGWRERGKRSRVRVPEGMGGTAGISRRGGHRGSRRMSTMVPVSVVAGINDAHDPPMNRERGRQSPGPTCLLDGP